MVRVLSKKTDYSLPLHNTYSPLDKKETIVKENQFLYRRLARWIRKYKEQLGFHEDELTELHTLKHVKLETISIGYI